MFLLPVVEPATGVTDDGDAADWTGWQRRILVEYRRRRRAERDSRLTRDHRERIGCRRSMGHAHVEAIDDKWWTLPLDDDTCDESSIDGELEPRRAARIRLIRPVQATRPAYQVAWKRRVNRTRPLGQEKLLSRQ